MKQIMEFLKANKAESEAERKADREMMAEMKTQIASFAYEMKADKRKIIAKIDKMDANQHDMEATIRSGHEEMIDITGASRESTEACEEKTKALPETTEVCPEVTHACLEKKEPTPEETETMAEPQKSPREQRSRKRLKQLRTELVSSVGP
jgi:hypothetical protein